MVLSLCCALLYILCLAILASWFGSCSGHYCSTDGDCGGVGECCMSNECDTFGCRECYSNSDCATSEYCCKHTYIKDHNVCRRSCGPREYCDMNNKCNEHNITLTGWAIPALVVGLLSFAIVAGGVFVYRYFIKRPNRVTTRVRPAERARPAIIAL